MALNHVFKSQNVKLWRRWLQNDYSLSLAPSYMKSASIFSLQNAQLECAIMEVSMYTELWKTVNFFFCNVMQFFLYFYFIFPSSTSISIRLSRGILFQYCSAYRNSILILKFPFFCCCLHIFHFIYVVNFLAFLFFFTLYKFSVKRTFRSQRDMR